MNFRMHPLTAAALAVATFSILPVMAQTTTTATATTAATATTTAAAPATPAAGPTALKIVDRKVGDGAMAESGASVAVHYTGYLWDASAPDNKGKKFDSSIERKVPFGFIIGAGRVIKGWDEGVPGMKVGGQRTLIIPSDKGYGARGAGGLIPPNATLVFDVELMAVMGKTQNPAAAPSTNVPTPKQ